MSDNPTARPVTPAGAPHGEPPAATRGATQGATPAPKKRMCMLCAEREATFVEKLGVSGDKTLWLRLCETCKPPYIVDGSANGDGNGRKPRKKTKNRIATTDYSEPISAILFRVAGCTLEQAGHFLWLYMPDHFETEEAAYEAARRTLLVMREQRQVEVVSIRRLWLGDAKRHGRRENFFRLSKWRGGAAIVEGAVAADEDPASALVAYRRPWKSGGLDHCSHRSDLYLLWAASAAVREDVRLDVEGMMSETHRDFPFRGAKLPEVDSGGEKLKLKSNARRKYEEVTPDGEFEAGFSVGGGALWVESPFLLELERRTNAGKVEEKLEKIAGYWHRYLTSTQVSHNVNLIRPVIVAHHDTREARAMGRKAGTGAASMRKTLQERLLGDASTLPPKRRHFKKLDEHLKKTYWEQGMQSNTLGLFVLFVEWEDLYGLDGSGDPFGMHYYPLSHYPVDAMGFASEDGWQVKLGAAAIQMRLLKDRMAKKGGRA